MIRGLIHPLTGTIARRLSLAFILLGAVATVIITAVQVYQDYQSEIKQINLQLDSIQDIHASSIAESVWSLSEKQIRIQLQGLLNTPGFDYIEISTPDDELWSVGNKFTEDILIRRIPLMHFDRGANHLYGTLLIQAGKQEIYARVSLRAINTLIYFASWIFILAVCQFLIFRHFVTRHLNHLAAYTSSMHFKSNEKDIILSRNISQFHSQDELDQVVNAINSMRSLVIDSLEETKKNEQLFRGLFENTDISIWHEDFSAVISRLNRFRSDGVTDLQAYLSKNKRIAFELAAEVKVVQVNDATLELFEAESREHLFKKMSKILGPGALEVFIEQLCAIWDKKKIFRAEANLRSLQGKKIIAIVSYLIPDTEEGFKSIPVSLFDITERKKNEEKLLTQSEIITNMAEGAFLIRCSDTRIVYTNPTFEKMFGYNKNEMLGKHLSLINAPDDNNPEKSPSKIFKELRQGQTWRGEVNNSRKDGSLFWCYANVSTFVHPEFGEVWLSVHTDISERKKAANALQRSQKMDAIGQLTGGIAHDFNNILGIIIGNLSFLKLQIVGSDQELITRVNTIDKAAQRAADLTKQLLSVSRKQEIKVEAFNINLLIESMESLIARSMTPEVEIKRQLSDDLWLTNISGGDFEDVLLNLTLNARDAMPKGGQLTLETCNCVLDATFCNLYPEISEGEYVQITISDSGSGMTAELQEHIFEPFFTTKPLGKGTGLGLAMVFGFIQRSNGHIRVHSKMGEGSSFIMYIPRSEGKDQSQSLAKVSDQIPAPSVGLETILVVDDEDALLELAKEFLLGLGYQVLTASNARQALEKLADNSSISLLFSDVVMPGGMNGYDLADQAAKQRPDLKILLTSGYTEKANAPNDKVRLNANLINKPYSLSSLAQRLRSLLGN